MNYYEHHIGDYTEATAHLSFVEDAAYSRMIRKYYSTERPLPSDPRALERLVGARTKDEKEAVRAVLEEFFVLAEDGWHNKRCDEELDRYRQKQAKARASADARWSKTESERNAKAMRTHPPSNANASITHNGRNALQTPDSRLQSPDSSPHAESERAPDPNSAHVLTEQIKAEYPPGTYRASNWILAERAIGKLLEGGASADELLAHARAFRVQQDAKASTGTQFVLSPEKFFGSDGHWRGPFPLPTAPPKRGIDLTWRPDPDEERRAAGGK